ncbi:MAG: hypothetical protein JRK53_05780, partial [Deltaproteobacteria bacterium]|nr:hypothetical protein [Deltaproteobacteria bacterium]
KTGYGAGEIQYLLPTSSVTPWRIAENLLDAARVIVREAGQAGRPESAV